METTPLNYVNQVSGRNQTMECCKLIASLFVVCIHIPFPGSFGGLISCLARFAVPMFFAISGYFSYQADCGRLRRRLLGIGKLYGAGVLLAFVLGYGVAAYNGIGFGEYLWWYVPGLKMLAGMLFFNESSFPYTPHLWYLLGMLVCYGILYGYVHFFDGKPVRYQPFYTACGCLFVIRMLIELGCCLGVSVPLLLYRNGILTGLPMFGMGLFLRDHQKQIVSAFRLNAGKLMGLALAGAALSVIQWKGLIAGELPFGSVLTAAAIVLLAVEYPVLPKPFGGMGKLIAKLGRISTVVYVVHLIIVDYYENFLHQRVILWAGEREGWFGPVIVAALSVLTGVLWEGLLWTGKKLRRSLRKPVLKK